MNKKSISTSILISRIIAILLLLSLAGLSFILPQVVSALCDTGDLVGDRASMTDLERGAVVGVAYAMVIVAAFAIVTLLRLLSAVSRGEVFTELVVRILATVSYCFFAEAVLFALLIYYFQLSLGVTLALVLVGLSIMIVRNVIAAARVIKEENDYTV